MIEVDLVNEPELLMEKRTNLRHVIIPEPGFIEIVYKKLRMPTMKPYMPIRDLSLYDTMVYVSEYMILSGGYGINTCYFPPDERRLSLADIDFITQEEHVEEVFRKVNEDIIRNDGVLTLRLGGHSNTIGLVYLNVGKMRWLRGIGVHNVYSYQRDIILPPIGNYVLRGETLLDYLKRRNFSMEKGWPRFVRTARKLGLDRFRVETIEIDVTLMHSDYVLKKPTPSFEIAGGGKYVKKIPTVRVIAPETAVNALKRALKFFYERKQTHNAVKTLIDLRLAKLINREREIRDIAMKMASDPEFSNEYSSGRESWRFAILRVKYPQLRLLVERWFS